MAPYLPGVFELVGDHCDLEERLPLVPPSARVRGMYLQHLERHIRQHGALAGYYRYVPAARWSSISTYPLTEYLIRLVVGASVIYGPERLEHACFEMTRDNVHSFMNSVLGRAMIRVLNRDPVRLLQQAIAARRHTHLYGHWELIQHSPRHVEFRVVDEYIWIKWCMPGPARGTFDAIGVDAEIEVILEDRFRGSSHMRW